MEKLRRSFISICIMVAVTALLFVSHMQRYTYPGCRNKSKTGIPLVLHQAWKTTEIGSVFTPYVLSWRKNHPDWLYKMWTDADTELKVKLHFPELESLYHKYPFDIQRADIFRYMVLYHYGGIYADLDMESLKSMNNLLDQFPCIIAQDVPVHNRHFPDGSLTNCLMACKPGHPFLKYVLDFLPEMFKKYKENVLWTTGPQMLEKALENYLNRSHIPLRYSGVYLKESEIYIAPWQMFIPMYDYRFKQAFMISCKRAIQAYENQRKMGGKDKPYILTSLVQQCQFHKNVNWYNSENNESYTNHHWSHVWNMKEIKFESTVNVYDLLKNAIFNPLD